MSQISVIILTHNEEADLPILLKSLSWCEDVHVVDDGSTDNTVQVAKEAGAQCYIHPFESFGRQRNWALENCNLRTPWVLFLDADEVATDAFVGALNEAVSNADDKIAGFFCCWKLMLDGVWLRRCDAFPKWQLRVVRRGRIDFIDFGHGQKEGETAGEIGFIREPYLHYAFSKGWAAWINRHNRYSSQEAVARQGCPIRWSEIFSKSPSERNKALKPLLSRLPGWPLLRFLGDYIVRLGILEGRPGFIYCVNMAFYEYLIRLKMRELRLKATEAGLIGRGETAETQRRRGNTGEERQF